MTTAREDVVAYLRDKLPQLKVLDTVEALTNLQRAGVMVTRSAIAHPPDNTADQRDDELTVWLVSTHVDLGKAEADLDENLDEVLAVIDAHEFLHWTAGERAMFNDEWHAFRLTVPHRTVTTEE
jgi:hypothetical protein